MTQIPSDLRYTKTHEWVKLDANNTIIIGLTEYAVENLGDIVFVELPQLEETFSAADEVVVVESAKTTSDVYSPSSGQIIEVNETLIDTPEIINEDPYGEGWLVRIKINNESDLDILLDASAYAENIEE